MKQVTAYHFNDDSFLWEQQEALSSNSITPSCTSDAMDIAKKVLLSDHLDFLKPFVHVNLFSLSNYNSTVDNCIKDLLEQIPIYFVNSSLCGQYTDDGHEIPNDTAMVNNISYKSIARIAEMKGWPCGESTGFEKMLKANTILGLYEHETMLHHNHFTSTDDIIQKPIRDYLQINGDRRIFLWVDHISEESLRLGCSQVSMLLNVLYHELGHSLLDVFTDVYKLLFMDCIPPHHHRTVKPRHERYFANPADFEEFARFMFDVKEESLANGLSLFLLGNTPGLGMSDHILIYNNIKDNPSIPYSLGVSYADKDILAIAIPAWMRRKKRGGRAYFCATIMLKTISKGPYIPKNDIFELERVFLGG